MDTLSMIQKQYEQVLANLRSAAIHSNRKPESVRLLVVTKGQPVEKIQAAYQAGARLFGENYPDETAEKIPDLNSLPDIEIHMIGHLQKRKAKIVAEHFKFMHSVDRLSIAGKLNKELARLDRKMPILLEMNVGGEESKQGFNAWDPSKWDKLGDAISKFSEFDRLQIKGLMAMPPLFEDPELARPFFRKLRELRDNLIQHFPDQDWNELSMGTSADYQVAIQEGATYIRVGSAIMGARPPKK